MKGNTIEPILWAVIGAGGVVALILCRLAAKHGWAWVEAKVKAKAAAAEADAKAKITAAVGDVDAKIKGAVATEVATIKADIAALKAKVGV